MGRKKIDIKPINGKRPRLITFSKRKSGLFKKAHELSILCQVQVAVIIFNDSRLFQYSNLPMEEILLKYVQFEGLYESKTPQNIDPSQQESEFYSFDPSKLKGFDSARPLRSQMDQVSSALKSPAPRSQ